MNPKRDKHSSKLDCKTFIFLKNFLRVLTKLKCLV